MNMLYVIAPLNNEKSLELYTFVNTIEFILILILKFHKCSYFTCGNSEPKTCSYLQYFCSPQRWLTYTDQPVDFFFFVKFLIWHNTWHLYCIHSQGCYNRVQQTEWLKTTEIYLLIVLEDGSLKSRCKRVMLPLKALGKNFPCLFLTFGIC